MPIDYAPRIGLHLQNVTIINSTPHTFELLEPNVVEMHLTNCTASKVFLNPFVSELVIEDSNVSEVIPHSMNQDEIFSLEEIHCYGTQISSIPCNISRLIKLQRIIFIQAQLKTMDFSMMNNLNDLRQILFDDCSIVEVMSNETVELPKLVDLNLSNNQISHIDTKRWNTPNLRHLTLDNNQLSQFPYVKHFPQLISINLNFNRISSINMEDVSDMNHLVLLFLQSNQIVQLEAFQPIRLPRLASIRIDQNQLQHLDISKWDMSSLTLFYVNDNQLDRIVGFEVLADSLLEFNGTNNPWNCVWALSNMGNFYGSIRMEWAKYC
ncbi:leucine-rich repeat-containing protein 7-like [Armigeres subalbatus]|uniref:leucine-rich repeat-containing protein 7-like n=1 Tax=Armigeres subalbatus TaxID=124917 RepID=UPI002ED15216